MTGPPAIVLDMAISHTDFRRTLCQAFGASVVPVGNDGYRVNLPDGAARIHLAPEAVRRIASLRYPATLVTIELQGLSAGASEHFLARFHQYFQRGGG